MQHVLSSLSIRKTNWKLGTNHSFFPTFLVFQFLPFDSHPMAVSRVLIASLVLSLLLLHVVEAVDEPPASSNNGTTIHCGSACMGRCRLASRKRRCMRACGSCCDRCKCVPPGTYGNEDVCPCYANMKTPKGTHKCP